MDHIDLKILDILQSDGRITMKELGLRVGLTSPATIERVKKLEEGGVIGGYKAIIDMNKAGLPFRAFILVTVDGERHEALTEFARNQENIVSCHRLAGSASHLLEVAAADLAVLEPLLNRAAALGKTETFTVLSSPVEHKNLVLP